MRNACMLLYVAKLTLAPSQPLPMLLPVSKGEHRRVVVMGDALGGSVHRITIL